VLPSLVALLVPFIMYWLSRRSKKSRLSVIGISVTNQDSAQDEPDEQQSRILSVGRIIIRNKGKFTALSVQAYIEKIIFDDKEGVVILNKIKKFI